MPETVDEPTVTVIIPTHDRPAGLAAAVESALAQTHRPLEVVVVDDGSDPPAEVPAPVRLLRLDRSQGPGRARNLGAELAEGDLLAFLDDDDVWRPHKLERQLAAMAEHGADVAFTGWSDSDDGVVMHTVVPPAEGIRTVILREPALVPSTVVVATAAFRGIDGYDETLRFGEDWDLSLRLTDRHRIVAVPEVLVERTFHPHRKYGRRLLDDHREMMRRLRPRLAPLPTGERIRIRTHHWRRSGTYRVRLLLEPAVVGRWPWRMRRHLRRQFGRRSGRLSGRRSGSQGR